MLKCRLCPYRLWVVLADANLADRPPFGLWRLGDLEAVAWETWIGFLRKGVDTTAESSDIFKAVAFKIGGRVHAAALAEVIVDDNGAVFWPTAHDIL